VVQINRLPIHLRLASGADRRELQPRPRRHLPHTGIRVRPAYLIAGPQNPRMGLALLNLLPLERPSLKLPLEIQIERAGQKRGRRGSGSVAELHKRLLDPLRRPFQPVVQAAGKEKGVCAGMPFSMVTEE
jgi:hypothetical protein